MITAKKPTRTVRLICRNAGGSMAFAITDKGKTEHYTAVPLDSSFGEAWRVEKSGVFTTPESSYDVLLADCPSCECMGFLRYGKCRHIDVLFALKKIS